MNVFDPTHFPPHIPFVSMNCCRFHSLFRSLDIGLYGTVWIPPRVSSVLLHHKSIQSMMLLLVHWYPVSSCLDNFYSALWVLPAKHLHLLWFHFLYCCSVFSPMNPTENFLSSNFNQRTNQLLFTQTFRSFLADSLIHCIRSMSVVQSIPNFLLFNISRISSETSSKGIFDCFTFPTDLKELSWHVFPRGNLIMKQSCLITKIFTSSFRALLWWLP